MIAITSDPIDRTRVLDRLSRPGDGATVVFEGVVRNHSQGKQVTHLFYETYRPMALQQMEKICGEVASRWPEVQLSVVHRIGRLEIGDVAVIVGASCPHRAEAFDACRFTIDRLKASVPIWKKEHYTDGAVWVEEGGGG